MSVSSKNIYLYGINGVYNYGCEAMIRSISSEFKSLNHDNNVIYMTTNYKYDSQVLKDCENVKLAKIESRANPIYKKIFRFLRRTLSIARPDDYLYFDTNWTKKCDVLIIIGGDVFEITPEQKISGKYSNDRIYVSQLVKRNGGKVILWGISVGNFDDSESAKEILLSYFNKDVDYAIIRDKKSYDYLKDNGINNISLCSDPAFIQRGIQSFGIEEKVLGVNLSPLSNRYLREQLSEEEWIKQWSDVIIRIFTDLKYDRVLLIPHVISDTNERDDDFRYMKKICSRLKELQIPVSIVSKDLGFIGVKQYLCECSLIIAARMHCAVNAITCGVPTVFLSYSSKSVGMCEHVYGNKDWVIDMNEIIESYNHDKILSISNDVKRTKTYLEKRNTELLEDAKRATSIIRGILDNE